MALSARELEIFRPHEAKAVQDTWKGVEEIRRMVGELERTIYELAHADEPAGQVSYPLMQDNVIDLPIRQYLK